jgi:hypothetical protein
MDKEKKDFVFKKGVWGVGLPVAILMSVTAGFQVPGYMFRLQGFNPKTFLLSLAVFTPIFLVAGYFWGLSVYKFIHKK